MNTSLINTNLYHLFVTYFCIGLFAFVCSLFGLNHSMAFTNKVNAVVEEKISKSGESIFHLAIPQHSGMNQLFGKPLQKRNIKSPLLSCDINPNWHSHFSQASGFSIGNIEIVANEFQRIRIHLRNCVLLN